IDAAAGRVDRHLRQVVRVARVRAPEAGRTAGVRLGTALVQLGVEDVRAARRRIARIVRAEAAVVAGDGTVLAAGRGVARIGRAGIAVVAADRLVDAAGLRIAAVGRADTVVVAEAGRLRRIAANAGGGRTHARVVTGVRGGARLRIAARA